MWIADLAWKWAPAGNNSQQQVRVLYEYAQVRGADPAAIFSENEWFWKEATYRAASYLDALAFVPTHFELITESVTETIKEHKERIKDALDKTDDLLSMVKKGALILAGVIGAAIVIPPVIRAFRDPDRRRD